jgi:ferric-dicitrate binding protein FerR (iron transport regulator)
MRPDDLLVPAEPVRDLTPDEIEAALAEDPEVTLISDYLTGALDAEAAAAVARRLEEDAGFQERVGPIVRAWHAWPGPTDFVQNDTETATRWERIVARSDAWRAGEGGRDRAWRNDDDAARARTARRQQRIWQLAAVLLLAVGLPLAGWAGASLWPRLTAPRVLVEQAPPGDGSTATVGPNSMVSLAPGARLTWRDRPDDRGRRELFLDGSASFMLTPLRAGEYLVITPAARIIVAGTRFDVQVTDPSTTLVTVHEGKVVLEARGNARGFDLLPLGAGEQGRVVWGAPPRRAQ